MACHYSYESPSTSERFLVFFSHLSPLCTFYSCQLSSPPFPRRLFGQVPSGVCSAAQNCMQDVGQVRSEMDVVLIEINYTPNEAMNSPRVLASVSWTVNDWKSPCLVYRHTTIARGAWDVKVTRPDKSMLKSKCSGLQELNQSQWPSKKTPRGFLQWAARKKEKSGIGKLQL